MSESINEDSGDSGNIEGEAAVAIMDNVAVENSTNTSNSPLMSYFEDEESKEG